MLAPNGYETIYRGNISYDVYPVYAAIFNFVEAEGECVIIYITNSGEYLGCTAFSKDVAFYEIGVD